MATSTTFQSAMIDSPMKAVAVNYKIESPKNDSIHLVTFARMMDTKPGVWVLRFGTPTNMFKMRKILGYLIHESFKIPAEDHKDFFIELEHVVEHFLRFKKNKVTTLIVSIPPRIPQVDETTLEKIIMKGIASHFGKSLFTSLFYDPGMRVAVFSKKENLEDEFPKLKEMGDYNNDDIGLIDYVVETASDRKGFFLVTDNIKMEALSQIEDVITKIETPFSKPIENHSKNEPKKIEQVNPDKGDAFVDKYIGMDDVDHVPVKETNPEEDSEKELTDDDEFNEILQMKKDKVNDFERSQTTQVIHNLPIVKNAIISKEDLINLLVSHKSKEENETKAKLRKYKQYIYNYINDYFSSDIKNVNDIKEFFDKHDPYNYSLPYSQIKIPKHLFDAKLNPEEEKKRINAIAQLDGVLEETSSMTDDDRDINGSFHWYSHRGYELANGICRDISNLNDIFKPNQISTGISMINEIIKGFEKKKAVVSTDLLVYRSTGHDKWLADKIPGDFVLEPGFLSTSHSRRYIRARGDTYHNIYMFVLPKGTPAVGLELVTEYHGEFEILLPPGSLFLLTEMIPRISITHDVITNDSDFKGDGGFIYKLLYVGSATSAILSKINNINSEEME